MNLFEDYQVLFIIRPPLIGLFLLVNNLILGIGVYLNGGFGKVENPASLAMATVSCIYSARCGYLPLISETVRTRWCKERADFEKAKPGLERLGIMSTIFAFMGLGGVISMLI